MLDGSDTASEGSASLAVNGEGWTEVTSVELGSLGAVKNTASLDVMLPSLASWGEVKLIFKIPSIGEYWRELGSSSLVGLEPGVFHTLSFAVPEDLQTKLADEVYEDFTATVIINGPTGTYLLDRLDVLGQPSGPPDIGPTRLSFSITLPEGVGLGDFTLAAAGQLQIKDRVEAYAGGELTPVYNAAGASELGADSKLGGLQSVGDVLLRNRAFIAGDVVSGGTIEKQYPGDVTILGDELENQEIPTHSISWSTVKPPAVGDVHLEPQTSKVLLPGSYDEVTVKSDADLYLRANEEYFFRTLTLESGGRLVLENTSGQIFIYIGESFVHRGQIVGLGNAPVPDLLVALSGAGTAHVERAFPGTLVAPNGTILLQPAPTGGHEGAFYAKDLTAEPDTIVHRRPFPWQVLTGVDVSDATPWIFDRSPVHLSANRDYDPSGAITGTAHPEAPVSFEVPEKIPVEGGNAGNGTLTLSFDHGGERVTCTYRGGATTLTDKSALERARGMYYVFESCSNGLAAGATTDGTDFELEIVDGAPFAGRTSVELALGANGCSGSLLPLIDPADSLQMAEEFSWGDTTALPETNPNGDPTLYYANIYIERYEQLGLLDAFLIHHDIKPMFTEEYEPWFGKCGTLDNAPDGHGLFVYAILPGGTYNLLRAATSHPDAPPEDRVQFKAIVLREPPAGTTYPDGSLRYDVLQEAGFQYMNLAALPPPEALDEELFGGGNSETLSNVLDVRAWVAQGAHLIVDGVMLGLGWVDRFLYGHVNVTANLTILNRDPLFEADTPMQRGWGNRLDAMGNPLPLPLPGVRIEINQWALRPTGGYLPTKYWSKTNRQGVAHLEVGRNNGGLAGGVSARGTCVRWANDTAAIRSGLTINETCDFRDDPDYDNFDHSVTVDLRTGAMDGHVLAAITEANDYADTAGLNVRHAEILTGPPAANVSPADGESERSLAWAPCLTFHSLSFDALQLAAKGFYPFQLASSSDVDTAAANLLLGGAYNEMLDNSDIVVPRHAPQRLSRGLVVHEYGHFIMCNLINQFDPKSLTLIGIDTLLEGANPIEANDHTRIANEAFADFISAQVVGATNYAVPLQNATQSQAMRYCNGNGLCLEVDANNSGSGNNQITRFVTLLHDAYDGMRMVTDIPTNGDNFLLQAAASGVACSGPGGDCLTAHAMSYGFDPNDDRVALPASSIDDVIFWGLQDTTFDPFSTSDLSEGLGMTMLNHGVNWCDMCDVFVRHDPDNPMGTLQQQWELCTQLPLSSYLPVGPPESDLRIRAADCAPCAPNETSDPNGVCVPCAGTVVGNTCGCSEHQIEPTPGTCVECAAHELADPITNTCVPCSVDRVIDIAALDPTALYCNNTAGNGPGDTCPDVVVADIQNLDAYLEPGITGQVNFDWQVQPDVCEGPTYLMFLDDTTGGVFPFHGSRLGAGTIESMDCREQPSPALSIDATLIAAGLRSVRVAVRTIDPAGVGMLLVVRPEFDLHPCDVE